MATELAKAYVQIIPSAQGIQGSISSVLDGEASSAGASAGEKVAGGLGATIGKAIAALGIGKMIADSITNTGDFESAMAKVSTLFTGTGSQFDGLQQKILDLSSAYGLGATTLAEAAYSAESAGVPVENLGALLESSARLATAGFTDIDTALSATAKTMNAYGMEGSEAISKVQNVLMQTQNLGITTVGELGAALANVTPAAAAAGVSFEQVGAALAQITASGVPTAQATTQLRSAIAELSKQGTKGAEALKAAAEGSKYAGMSFQEMIASGANMGEVFGMMQAYADSAGVSMLDLWSSVEAGNAAMIIASDVEQFGSNLEAMASEADNVGAAYDKMADTFNNSMSRLKESAKNFMTTLFTGGDVAASFDAMLNNLGDVGAKLTTWLTNAISGLGQSLPQMMSSLLDFGGSIMESLAKIDWISLGTNIINGIIGALGTLGQQLITLIGNAITAVTSGGVDFAAIGGAIWNGVTSIITTAGDWLGKLFETAAGVASSINFDSIGTAILEGVKGILTGAGNFLSGIFGGWRDDAAEIDYSSIGSAILSGVRNIFDSVTGFLSDIFTQEKETVESQSLSWETVGQAITAAVELGLNGCEFLAAAFEAGAELVKGINWTNVGEHAEELIVAGLNGATTLVEAFTDAANRLLDSVGWEEIGRGITDLVVVGLDGAAALVDTFVNAASDLINSVGWESIGQGITDLVVAGLGGLESLVNVFSEAASTLLSSIGWEDIGEGITDLVVQGLNGVSAIVESFTTAASDLVSGIDWAGTGRNISGLVNAGLEGAGSVLDAGFHGAVDFIQGVDWAGIGESISGALSTAFEGIGGFLGGLLGGAGEAAQGIGTGIGQAAEGIGTAIKKLFAGDDMQNAVTDLQTAMDNLNKAIEDGKNTLIETAKGIGSGIKTSIQEELTPDALSTIGESVISGIESGITSQMVSLASTVDGVKTAMVNGFKQADVWNGAGESAMSSIEAGLGSKAASLTNAMTRSMDDIIAKVKAKDWTGTGVYMMDQMQSGAESGSKSLFVKISGLMDTAVTTIQNKPWSGVGSNIVSGIVAGVNAAAGTLISRLQQLAMQALAAAKGALGISSPSKVFKEQVGQWIPKGVAEGIKAASGSVKDSMNEMSEKISGKGVIRKITNMQKNRFNDIAESIKKSGKKIKAEIEHIVGDVTDEDGNLLDTTQEKMKDMLYSVAEGLTEGVREGKNLITEALNESVPKPADATIQETLSTGANSSTNPASGTTGVSETEKQLIDKVEKAVKKGIKSGFDELDIDLFMDGQKVSDIVNKYLGKAIRKKMYAST